MNRLREQEHQDWADLIARYQQTIADHESEIAKIRQWWESEHRADPVNSRIAYLENEIAVQRVCLDAALEKRQLL